MKHQEDTGDGEDDKKEAGNAAQTERVTELKAMAFDFYREDMEEEIVIEKQRLLQICIGDSGSEDRTPNRRI
jgi:hypothetical protein